MILGAILAHMLTCYLKKEEKKRVDLLFGKKKKQNIGGESFFSLNQSELTNIDEQRPCLLSRFLFLRSVVAIEKFK